MYGPSSICVCCYIRITHTRTRSYIYIFILFIYRYARAFRCLIILQWTSPDDFKSKLHNFKRFSTYVSVSVTELSLNMKFLLQTYKLTLCKYKRFRDIFRYLLWINWLWSLKLNPIWISLCLWWFFLLLLRSPLFCCLLFLNEIIEFCKWKKSH